MKKNLAFNFALVVSFVASLTGIILAISVENNELVALFSVTSVMVVAAAVAVWREK